MMSDRMPNFLITSLNYTDTNFRILTVSVADAIAGTVCEDSPSLPWQFGGVNNLWWNR